MATTDAAASVTTASAPNVNRPGLTPRSTIAAIPRQTVASVTNPKTRCSRRRFRRPDAQQSTSDPAFNIQALYSKTNDQVTLWATIT